ncbi:unnamed protein product, partial [Anisakis simplex]|uniref:CCHC-type domain-containing protein n=1 Tax=Anisakis simplex TaxID=6269 RepID=A0A0M3KIG1_ANISI
MSRYRMSESFKEWHTENHQNLSDLWFGFLDYFSQRFDFASEVIQIRRREPISKLDKGWQGRPIAIEDPFELQHNLSSGNNLFSACHVNSGPPLARNCCHRCKQIGHFVENCPLSQQKGHRRRSGTTTNNQPSTPSKEAYAMRQTHTAAVNRPKELVIRSAPASADNQRPLLQTPNNNIFTTTGRGMSSVGGFGVRQRQRLNSNGQ